MDQWESHFRLKSRRRSLRRNRQRIVKVAALSLFIASLIASAWLLVLGLPE